MEVMLTVVCLVIYLTIGMGVFWILSEWQAKLRTNLYEKTERIEAYQEYGRRTTWIPKTVNVWITLTAIALGIVIWMLWPIVSIGSTIWYELTYKKLLRKYST